MKGVIKQSITIALTVGTLALVLTGCCMFCDKSCCRKDDGCPPKTSGVNTSMSVGVGTDGAYVGGAANVGNHGASGSVGGKLH